MQRIVRRSIEPDGMVHRRRWLIGAAAACAGAWARADEIVAAKTDTSIDAAAPAAEDEDEDRDRKEIETRAQEVQLGPCGVTRTPHYLAVGNAGEVFRSRTLVDCEAVRADYMDYYRARGFELAEPGRRLTVVTLNSQRSFASFLGNRDYAVVRENELVLSATGVYQPRTNRLVVFDHRGGLGRAGAPENLRVLAHEATHQLTFNTGLLKRGRDIPVCIAEGIALYGELRRPSSRTPPGERNPPWISQMTSTKGKTSLWIPLTDLLTSDRLLRRGAIAGILLAYAESWLLVHYLMSEPASRVGFRLYLKAIRDRTSAASRAADAQEYLGDLDRLNGALREYLERLRGSRSGNEVP